MPGKVRTYRRSILSTLAAFTLLLPIGCRGVGSPFVAAQAKRSDGGMPIQQVVSAPLVHSNDQVSTVKMSTQQVGAQMPMLGQQPIMMSNVPVYSAQPMVVGQVPGGMVYPEIGRAHV